MIYDAPVKDMVFLIDEWIGLDRITSLPGYEDLDRDTLESILEEAGRFCSSELLTINQQGDEHGATCIDGVVKTPPGFREAYRKFAENGWNGVDADPEHGGMGLPKLVHFQVDEMASSCNLSFNLYPGLSHGAYHLLESSASQEICDLYLPKMVEGAWSGTMCLTEPHAGTDLGLLNTKAVPQADGSYSISGTKIFITAGDHDLTENIVHMAIARVEGAPAGSRGISLFLVPKFLVNADGSPGDRNHVETASIEHKMGIRGSATCVLNFDGARGYLIGEENKGLAAMFVMMNIERISVGLQGLGLAEIACQNALAYAKERLQSKAPPPRPDAGKAADPILYQPEVKRMLLKIRSQVDGARALAVFTGLQADLSEKSPEAEAREEAEDMLALLTPLVKSYLTDLGMSSTLSAQQVFGGHGYVSEHGMEQLARDCRITQIYEGTNEVQAQDLVTRKLTIKGGRLANRFFERWERFFQAHENDAALADYIQPSRAAFTLLREATDWIKEQLQSDPAAAKGAATDCQRMFGLTTIACLWADIAASIKDKQGDFYDNKRKLARFYMNHVLPETAALHQVVTRGADSLAAFDVEDFGL
jgi:butyryl-CoA dehydrogenase